MVTAWRDDPGVAEARLNEAVRRLVAALQPERIYLFGSRARGDFDADSDWDLLVVVRMPAVAWASFSVKGTPCSGPQCSPRARASSASRARSYARSASSVMTAFKVGLCASICAKCAFSTSVAETWPARMAAANCVVLEKTISIMIAPACRSGNRRLDIMTSAVGG